jgi:hypothetical protein
MRSTGPDQNGLIGGEIPDLLPDSHWIAQPLSSDEDQRSNTERGRNRIGSHNDRLFRRVVLKEKPEILSYNSRESSPCVDFPP